MRPASFESESRRSYSREISFFPPPLPLTIRGAKTPRTKAEREMPRGILPARTGVRILVFVETATGRRCSDLYSYLHGESPSLLAARRLFCYGGEGGDPPVGRETRDARCRARARLSQPSLDTQRRSRRIQISLFSLRLSPRARLLLSFLFPSFLAWFFSSVAPLDE